MLKRLNLQTINDFGEYKGILNYVNGEWIEPDLKEYTVEFFTQKKSCCRAMAEGMEQKVLSTRVEWRVENFGGIRRAVSANL